MATAMKAHDPYFSANSTLIDSAALANLNMYRSVPVSDKTTQILWFPRSPNDFDMIHTTENQPADTLFVEFTGIKTGGLRT